MLLTPKQIAEMTEAARPLIKWLAENTHPNCEAHVDYNSVELVEMVARETVNDFMKG